MGDGKGKVKIEIEIPKEFEGDYNSDKFEDFFMRVLADIDWNGNLCGNYEKETGIQGRSVRVRF